MTWRAAGMLVMMEMLVLGGKLQHARPLPLVEQRQLDDAAIGHGKIFVVGDCGWSG